MTEWKPVGWAEEKGQISAGVGPALDRRQRERQAFCFRQQFPTRGDKAVRAQSIRGRMALEGLYVPTGASWYPTFRSELLSFPAGKHDDQVDALGLVGQLLDQMVPGQKPRAPRSRSPTADIVLLTSGSGRWIGCCFDRISQTALRQNDGLGAARFRRMLKEVDDDRTWRV